MRDELAFIASLVSLALVFAFVWPEWTGERIGKFVASFNAAALHQPESTAPPTNDTPPPR